MPHPSSAPPHVDDADFGARLVALTPRLRGFVRRLCLRDADDLVQEALARAWRSRAAYSTHNGSLDAWLMQIAFRTFLDQRARRTPVALGDGDVAVAAPRDLGAELREEIAAAMRGLQPIERDVLLRFHRDRQSVEEIARALAMPAGTVKSHLRRARMRLAPRGGS